MILAVSHSLVIWTDYCAANIRRSSTESSWYGIQQNVDVIGTLKGWVRLREILLGGEAVCCTFMFGYVLKGGRVGKPNSGVRGMGLTKP